MKNNYKTILRYGEDEFIIDRSRFIGYALPCEREEEALEFIDKIRKDHPQATHHCYAYYVVEDSVIRKRYNDDGEPQGTAGLPMLSVIEKEGLLNLCVISVRYFGGIKLGKGGLVRAYTKSTQIAVEAGIVVEMIEYALLKLTYNYSISGKLDYYFEEKSSNLSEKKYDTDVSVILYENLEKLDNTIKDLNDITSGSIEIEEIARNFYPTDRKGRIINE